MVVDVDDVLVKGVDLTVVVVGVVLLVTATNLWPALPPPHFPSPAWWKIHLRAILTRV